NDSVGLHPELKGLASLLESGRLAIIQGVGYPNPSRSHFRSMAYWQTARFDEKSDGPGWLGVALDDLPQPRDRSPASVFIGLQTPPPSVKGRRCVSSALAHLDDLVLAGEGNPGRAFQGQPDGTDLKAYVRRTLLDAYTTADRLKEAAVVKDNA